MKIHNFHFLINTELKTELNKIEELSTHSFSGKICLILKKINNFSQYLDKLKINEYSKVENLLNKKNIHLYMKEKLYENLKSLHGKYNTYSIALLVRIIIKIFIKVEKKYGFKGALKHIKKQTKKMKKIDKLENKRLSIVQLLNLLNLKHNKDLKFGVILTKLLL